MPDMAKNSSSIECFKTPLNLEVHPPSNTNFIGNCLAQIFSSILRTNYSAKGLHL